MRFYGEVLPANFAAARRLTQLKLAQMARAHDVRYKSGGSTRGDAARFHAAAAARAVLARR